MRVAVFMFAALVAVGVLFVQLQRESNLVNGAADDRYLTSWSEALSEARAQGKPIFLNFGGDW